MISGSSFPPLQFHLGYATSYRSDRNVNSGGILLYITEDIRSRLRNSDLSIEGFFVELRLRKNTWLLWSSYNPKKNVIANYLKCIGRNLDSQLGKYENFILMGDFSVKPNNATRISVKSMVAQILSKIKPVPKIPQTQLALI